jgi:hypothetical protein
MVINMHGLIKKIIQYERKKLLLQILSGGITITAILPAIWMVATIADMVFTFSTASRWSTLIICILSSLSLIGLLLVLPVIRLLLLTAKKDLSAIALEIGMQYEDIQDKLLNTYQLISQQIALTSDQLRRAAIDRFEHVMRTVDFRIAVKLKHFLFSPLAVIILFSATLFLYYSFKERLEISFTRIINPSAQISLLPAGNLQVIPGDTNVVLGHDLPISVISGYPHTVACYLKYKPQSGSGYEQFALNDQEGIFRGELKNLRAATVYQIIAEVENKFKQKEVVISPQYTATVLIPPMITELKVKLDPPPYTGLEAEYLENNIGTVIAYPGSKVSLRATANKEVEKAVVQFSDSTHMEAAIKGKSLQASFLVQKPLNYVIKLKDAQGVENPDPIEYSITLLEDQYPFISLIIPGEDIEMAADAAINLLMEAEDDFGLTQLSLYYQIISSMTAAKDSSWQKIVLKANFNREKYIQFGYSWDFQYLPVSFEDLVHYYVEVQDNDVINGPKKARSQVFSIFFPTINQMLNEFARDQKESIAELKEISERNNDLQQDVDKINRELKRENSINWEKKQEIENLLKQQEELQKRIEEMQNNLNEALSKLEQNELISTDILEKYQQLQELFREIATPELLQAMEDIQKALMEMDKKKLDAAINSFKIDQQILKENIERTLELFQKIQKEQQYDAAMQLAKKIAEQQEQITNQIENDRSGTGDKDEIEQRQLSQKENFSSFDQSIAELSQDDFPQLEQVSSYIEQEAISQKMDKVLEFLATDGKMSGIAMSTEITSDMNSIYSQMQRLRQEIVANEKNRLLDEMMKITQDLIMLSVEEENLKNQSVDLSNYSDKYVAISQQQQEIHENLRQVTAALVTLSQETFFIPAELNRHIGTAYGQMTKSIDALEERNNQVAANSQKEAMASLNAAVLSLQNTMQMMASAKSALGFEYFLKQMQKMAGQQSTLNDASMNFLQGNGNHGNMNNEQLAELARLAAEQRKIRESLQSLSKEMGNRSDIPGRLDETVQEMETVEKALERLQIDRQTIARQQRILRRMLDAQKSVHEREYSQKRKAEVGRGYVIQAPDKNQKISNALLERIEAEREQALREGYSHDYEKLIELYFKKLSENSADD